MMLLDEAVQEVNDLSMVVATMEKIR